MAAFVQAEGPVLPEFKSMGNQAKACPVGWAGNVPAEILGGNLGDPAKEMGARGQWARLVRRQRTDL